MLQYLFVKFGLIDLISNLFQRSLSFAEARNFHFFGSLFKQGLVVRFDFLSRQSESKLELAVGLASEHGFGLRCGHK